MVKLKLCGITRREDYLLADELGIDYAGFVFVSESPRHVSPSQVWDVLGTDSISNGPVPVGIFADQKPSDVLRICSEAGISIAQLHGRESLLYCKSLGIDFWKVVTSASELKKYPESVCTPVLLDASGVERTGASLNRILAERTIATGRKVILAGGLCHENIHEFLQLKPWGVDFSSSVEKKPGIKDHKRVETLVKRIRGFSNDQ